MTAKRLLENVESWLDDFRNTIVQWDQWLGRCQLQYLLGHFDALSDLKTDGQNIVARLQSLHRWRHDLLDLASELGYPGNNLYRVSQALDSEFSTRMAERVEALQPRMRSMSQQNVSLWLSMLHAESHTAGVLRIMSTGSSAQATYHPNECESIGGGQLVNQAA